VKKRFFVYVLASTHSGKLRTYVGWTHDLDTRVEKHNSGRGAKATRGRAWILFYAERHRSRIGAMRREWALKHDRAFRALLRDGARDAFA
jgi:putative endonuclease